MEKRLDWIDAIKGLGIVFVLLGHAHINGIGKVWVYTFHLGLFFFCTGFTFSADKYATLQQFINRKIKTLILPYVILSITCFAFSSTVDIVVTILHGHSIDIFYYCKRFLGIFLQVRNSVFEGYCWFIMLVFVIDIFYYIIFNATREKNLIRWIVVILFYFAAGVYMNAGGRPLPWHIDAAILSIVFVNIGNTLKEYNITLSSKKIIILSAITSVIIAIFEYKKNFRCDIFESSIGNLALFLLGNFAGFTIFSYLMKQNGKFSGLINIGKNSLIIYALHQAVVYRIFKPAINLLFKSLVKEYSGHVVVQYLKSFLLIGITLVILRMLIPLYNRIYNGIVLTIFDNNINDAEKAK